VLDPHHSATDHAVSDRVDLISLGHGR
jgi:hypothetical protein